MILYMSCRGSNDTSLKLRYKRYCKLLIDVIKTVKKKYYDELISKSKNKTKTAWKIIKKKEIVNNDCNNDIKSLKMCKNITNNPQEIANTINLLNLAGHVMHQQFNIQQLYVLPTLYLCVLYLSENKQRLAPLTA